MTKRRREQEEKQEDRRIGSQGRKGKSSNKAGIVDVGVE